MSLDLENLYQELILLKKYRAMKKINIQAFLPKHGCSNEN